MPTHPKAEDFAKVQLRLTNVLTSSNLSKILQTVQKPDPQRVGDLDIKETFRSHGLTIPDDTKVQPIGAPGDPASGFRLCVAGSSGKFHCADITFHWPIEVDPG